MRRLIIACWLLLAAALTFVGADVGQVPKAGGGGSTSLASGSTPVTGCQNLVLYGNNSNLVECEAAFGYTTASNTLDVDTANVDTLDVDTAATVTLGTGTGKGSVGGVLCQAAPVVATVGTSEESLASCPLPANSLNAAGSRLRITTIAHTAANANLKRLRIAFDFAGTPIYVATTGNTAFNNQVLLLEANITRLTSGTVAFYSYVRYLTDGAAALGTTLDFGDSSISLDLTAAQTITFAGTTASAAGDLTLDSYIVEVLQ